MAAGHDAKYWTMLAAQRKAQTGASSGNGSARKWLNKKIEKLMKSPNKHGGRFQEEFKKELKILGKWKLHFKFGAVGEVTYKSSDDDFCTKVSAYAAFDGQLKGPVFPGNPLMSWLQYVVEPSIAASGKIECCTCEERIENWTFRAGSMYCKGDIKITAGVKAGLRAGFATESEDTAMYVEGGIFVGGSYSFRRDEFNLVGYGYIRGVMELKITDKWKMSNRMEYRYGSNVDF